MRLSEAVATLAAEAVSPDRKRLAGADATAA